MIVRDAGDRQAIAERIVTMKEEGIVAGAIRAGRKLESNSEYGKGWQGSEVTQEGRVDHMDAVSAYPADLPESQAEKDWRQNTTTEAARDLLTAYAEKSGFAYGFIQGLMYKLQATQSLLENCKTPQCNEWVIKDLAAMGLACYQQLREME